MDESHIPGLVGIIVFYLLILGIGVFAAWSRKGKKGDSEEVMLAGRSIGTFVGILTMTGKSSTFLLNYFVYLHYIYSFIWLLMMALVSQISHFFTKNNFKRCLLA